MCNVYYIFSLGRIVIFFFLTIKITIARSKNAVVDVREYVQIIYSSVYTYIYALL